MNENNNLNQNNNQQMPGMNQQYQQNQYNQQMPEMNQQYQQNQYNQYNQQMPGMNQQNQYNQYNQQMPGMNQQYQQNQQFNMNNMPTSQIEEQQRKVFNIVNKIVYIYKKIVLGIIILVLAILVLIDGIIFKQTMEARNYIDAVAEYVEIKESEEDSVFNEALYSFTDKKGNTHTFEEIYSKDESPEMEIRIKYNENDPDDYFTEGATLTKSGIIWFVVKIIVLVLLIFLFFNKKLLSKINISISSR